MSRIERYCWFQFGCMLITTTEGWSLLHRVVYFLGTGAIFIALVPYEKK